MRERINSRCANPDTFLHQELVVDFAGRRTHQLARMCGTIISLESIHRYIMTWVPEHAKRNCGFLQANNVFFIALDAASRSEYIRWLSSRSDSSGGR